MALNDNNCYFATNDDGTDATLHVVVMYRHLWDFEIIIRLVNFHIFNGRCNKTCDFIVVECDEKLFFMVRI